MLDFLEHVALLSSIDSGPYTYTHHAYLKYSLLQHALDIYFFRDKIPMYFLPFKCPIKFLCSNDSISCFPTLHWICHIKNYLFYHTMELGAGVCMPNLKTMYSFVHEIANQDGNLYITDKYTATF